MKTYIHRPECEAKRGHPLRCPCGGVVLVDFSRKVFSPKDKRRRKR